MWKRSGGAPLLSGLALLLGTGLATAASEGGTSKPGSSPTHACRIEGMPNEMQCGSVMRPLDPAKPQGTQIEIHYLVVPAMARNKQPDPGADAGRRPRPERHRGGAAGVGRAQAPEQPARSGLHRPARHRQIGTAAMRRRQQAAGRGRPGPASPGAPPARLPGKPEPAAHGDLRMYTTTIAMQDLEAVRVQLGAPQWNLYGASYGTRAALEYMRQFPKQVRRALIDGVAPPDMVLPASFSTDNQPHWTPPSALARKSRPARPATRSCAPSGRRCWPACRARSRCASP